MSRPGLEECAFDRARDKFESTTDFLGTTLGQVWNHGWSSAAQYFRESRAVQIPADHTFTRAEFEQARSFLRAHRERVPAWLSSAPVAGILGALDGHDEKILRDKVANLKTGDGENWAIGELVERVLALREVPGD